MSILVFARVLVFFFFSFDYSMYIFVIGKNSECTPARTGLFENFAKLRAQGVRNVSFSENFTYVLNGWLPSTFSCDHFYS